MGASSSAILPTLPSRAASPLRPAPSRPVTPLPGTGETHGLLSPGPPAPPRKRARIETHPEKTPEPDPSIDNLEVEGAVDSESELQLDEPLGTSNPQHCSASTNTPPQNPCVVERQVLSPDLPDLTQQTCLPEAHGSSSLEMELDQEWASSPPLTPTARSAPTQEEQQFSKHMGDLALDLGSSRQDVAAADRQKPDRLEWPASELPLQYTGHERSVSPVPAQPASALGHEKKRGDLTGPRSLAASLKVKNRKGKHK